MSTDPNPRRGSDDGLDIFRTGLDRRLAGAETRPAAPAIILDRPKFPHNVGNVIRLASAYGIEQVWYSGDRLKRWVGGRLPREERMRRYREVALVNDPDPLGRFLDAIPGLVPVAVELRPNTESLVDFVHPDADPEIAGVFRGPVVYVFGPEDGSLPGSIVKRCHRFVVIPSFECLNLATAVATVLYDRMAKSGERPKVRDRGRRVEETVE